MTESSDAQHHAKGQDVSTDQSFIQIAPGVTFSAAVFTPVQFAQPSSRKGERADRPRADVPPVDPRQIDLWTNDVDHAPGVTYVFAQGPAGVQVPDFLDIRIPGNQPAP